MAPGDQEPPGAGVTGLARAGTPRPHLELATPASDTLKIVEVVDPGDPTSWPRDIRAEVDRLAALCRSNPENVDRPSLELEISPGAWDEDPRVELAFRDLLGDRLITYYHATGLLPHEDQMYRDDGLLVLTDELRDRRLDQVIELYGDELGREALGSLRTVGPACPGSVQRPYRIGLLHGVTPLDAVRHAGEGMEKLMTHWGGESCLLLKQEDPPHAAVCERSTSTIVEAAVSARDLCAHRSLWRVFVGQADRWDKPWNEFSTKVSVPATRILAILHPGSERWPLPTV
jgi:hypothetical protein